jgi:hypothetical protein
LPGEGFNTKDNETRVSLGKPGKVATKESEEGAIGVEAKEESNELPIEGANTNDIKTLVFFGKPGNDGPKELEKEE